MAEQFYSIGQTRAVLRAAGLNPKRVLKQPQPGDPKVHPVERDGTPYWPKAEFDAFVEYAKVNGVYEPLPLDEPIPVTTVGQLRQALSELPDDTMIHYQVIGQQSGAWNMGASLVRRVRNGTITVMSIEHPRLQHLPMDWDDDSEAVYPTADFPEATVDEIRQGIDTRELTTPLSILRRLNAVKDGPADGR